MLHLLVAMGCVTLLPPLLSPALVPITLLPPLTPRTLAPQMLVGKTPKSKSVATNKLARRNYEILEDFEAGVSLKGTEVKSARDGRVTLRDGFCVVKDGECWLRNVNIARHSSSGSYFQHEETRPRRLLLHKREIRKLEAAIDQRGLTIVPLSCYFNEKSFLKVSIGLARGKKQQDKREDLKRKDAARDVARQIKAFQ